MWPRNIQNWFFENCCASLEFEPDIFGVLNNQLGHITYKFNLAVKNYETINFSLSSYRSHENNVWKIKIQF